MSMVDLSKWAPLGMKNHQNENLCTSPFGDTQLEYTAHPAHIWWSFLPVCTTGTPQGQVQRFSI